MYLRLLPAAAVLIATTAALAQDASQDWEMIRQDGAVFAFVPLTTGLTIGVRCNDGAFDAVIAGLPEARRQDRTRTISFKFGEEPLHPTRWNVTTDRTVAIADYPASFARKLRQGGPVSIVIPGGAEGGRNLRHQIDLPASNAAVEQTLAACDRPLEDPRDALLPEIEEGGLPLGLTWTRAPRPRYPRTNYAGGYAVVSCLAADDGALTQCQIEAEQPGDGRFGRAALDATDEARVSMPAQPVTTPRIVSFRVNFQMAR